MLQAARAQPGAAAAYAQSFWDLRDNDEVADRRQVALAVMFEALINMSMMRAEMRSFLRALAKASKR